MYYCTKKWFWCTQNVRWRKPKMMIDTGSDHRWQGRAMSIPLQRVQRCIDCIHFRYTSTIDNSSIIQTLILISLCSYPVCEQEALLTYIQHNYMQHIKPIRHERLLESRQFHGLDMPTPYRRKYSFFGVHRMDKVLWTFFPYHISKRPSQKSFVKWFISFRMFTSRICQTSVSFWCILKWSNYLTFKQMKKLHACFAKYN